MSADTSAFPVARAVALILAHVPSLVRPGPARLDPADDHLAGQQVRLGFVPEEAICVPDR